jgi:hypothetical protein
MVKLGGTREIKKEVNDLTWKFICDNNPNQIERNVCCLNIDEGGGGNDSILEWMRYLNL